MPVFCRVKVWGALLEPVEVLEKLNVPPSVRAGLPVPLPLNTEICGPSVATEEPLTLILKGLKFGSLLAICTTAVSIPVVTGLKVTVKLVVALGASVVAMPVVSTTKSVGLPDTALVSAKPVRFAEPVFSMVNVCGLLIPEFWVGEKLNVPVLSARWLPLVSLPSNTLICGTNVVTAVPATLILKEGVVASLLAICTTADREPNTVGEKVTVKVVVAFAASVVSMPLVFTVNSPGLPVKALVTAIPVKLVPPVFSMVKVWALLLVLTTTVGKLTVPVLSVCLLPPVPLPLKTLICGPGRATPKVLDAERIGLTPTKTLSYCTRVPSLGIKNKPFVRNP